MKKVLASSVVVLMVFFLSAGLGLAGNGKGGGNGNGGGNGVGGNGGGGGGTGLSLICAGDPVEIAGTVSQGSHYGSGLQIDTMATVDLDPIVAVYGIGPYWFWEDKGVARPEIGDEVSVDGVAVTFSDESIKIIAMSITVNGVELQLRVECVDEAGNDVVGGGQPLWRGGRNNN